jgi:hypothetical protein
MAVAEPDMTLFNSSITELTTAATDAAIALVAAGCVLALNRHRARDPRRVQIWTWVFGLLVLASVLGALAHGLDLSATVRAWLWQPLYLTLGLIVAMFVVAALYDFRGEQAARRALLPMLALAFGLGHIPCLPGLRSFGDARRPGHLPAVGAHGAPRRQRPHRGRHPFEPRRRGHPGIRAR